MSKVSALTNMVSQARSGEYVIHGDPIAAECVMAQSFGLREMEYGTIEPGESNYALAHFIHDNYDYLPKILQFEIDDAFKNIGGEYAECRIEKHREEGKYLDTREVVSQGAVVMEENKWHSALVVAQAHHMPRADAAVRRLGVNTVAPEGLPAGWDRESAQWYTRSWEQFFAREVPVIGYYALRGWLDLTERSE